MARMQFLARRESAHIYLSIGMPETDIKKMIFLEMRSVLLISFIWLLVSSFVVSACFEMLVG